MAVALMDRAAGQAKLPETPAVVALFAFGSRLDRDTMQLFARTHSEEVRAAAIASTICRESVTVKGAESVAKSYPDFWKDLEALGGRIEQD